MMLILFKRCGLMASAHHAVSGELSMRDERRPGLDGPGLENCLIGFGVSSDKFGNLYFLGIPIRS